MDLHPSSTGRSDATLLHVMKDFLCPVQRWFTSISGLLCFAFLPSLWPLPLKLYRRRSPNSDHSCRSRLKYSSPYGPHTSLLRPVYDTLWT
ncbi:uncharacterized protein BT62DRAFT_205799 [Guyanagaster necrorhizus]|uniref:Uncharacterized protein n=1 Tax=Guyanagaster necrorhizus TaxID=856835 RepID=A0A9P7VR16_9AGAR|nr:uncharacterized protein BT62DRAFT_205799 [Guyanagaster necrorhizus MCA 3950]KAG7445017.1 hypothetical protein BT62DRAFT_205799 [Guyanagaster necrorhizus MCA 3950]